MPVRKFYNAKVQMLQMKVPSCNVLILELQDTSASCTLHQAELLRWNMYLYPCVLSHYSAAAANHLKGLPLPTSHTAVCSVGCSSCLMTHEDKDSKAIAKMHDAQGVSAIRRGSAFQCTAGSVTHYAITFTKLSA